MLENCQIEVIVCVLLNTECIISHILEAIFLKRKWSLAVYLCLTLLRGAGIQYLNMLIMIGEVAQ